MQLTNSYIALIRWSLQYLGLSTAFLLIVFHLSLQIFYPLHKFVYRILAFPSNICNCLRQFISPISHRSFIHFREINTKGQPRLWCPIIFVDEILAVGMNGGGENIDELRKWSSHGLRNRLLESLTFLVGRGEFIFKGLKGRF